MALTHIKQGDFPNWQEYYWAYQYTLATEYYIPLLTDWNIQLENKNILDIGCGNGGFAAALGKTQASVTGVEIKPFPWKENSNVRYVVQDITSENATDSIGNDFDVIILRDVIEHIPLIKKQNFLNSALQFGNSSVKTLITFPPFYSPFGIHQQTFLKSILRKIPYLGLKPLWALIPLLKLFGENKESIQNIREMHSCRMTLSGFEKLIHSLQLVIEKERYYLIRPSHEIRYGWRTIEMNRKPIWGLRELGTLGVTYLLRRS